MLCGEASVVNVSAREIVAAPLRCRSWGHPPCAEMRKYQLMQLALDGQPDKFLTLTSRRRPGLTATKAANDLRDAWAIVYREIVRKHGKANVSCLAIFEKTKLGWPHLHILCRMPYVYQGWLSERMRALIRSPVVDIRAMDDLRIRATYVTKYVAKDPSLFQGCKRYWRSLDWIVEPDDNDPEVAHDREGWEADRRSVFAIECWLTNQGWQPYYKGEVVYANPLWPEFTPWRGERLHDPPQGQ